jgi:hypothetical protein
MDPLQELLDWATSHGVKLNGILPERIPGRGIGVLATRDIQVKPSQSKPHAFCPFQTKLRRGRNLI